MLLCFFAAERLPIFFNGSLQFLTNKVICSEPFDHHEASLKASLISHLIPHIPHIPILVLNVYLTQFLTHTFDYLAFDFHLIPILTLQTPGRSRPRSLVSADIQKGEIMWKRFFVGL